MKHLVFSTALCLGAVACGSSTSVKPDSTLLIRYSRVPTSVDSGAVRGLGARSALVIRIAGAVVARGPADARYSALPYVLRWDDLGPGEDPERSVFIYVVDAPTPEDSAFVASLGAWPIETFPQWNMIGTIMRLGVVSRLGERARFTRAEIGTDDNVPQP